MLESKQVKIHSWLKFIAVGISGCEVHPTLMTYEDIKQRKKSAELDTSLLADFF